VGKSRRFFLHSDLLAIESEVFLKSLGGNFKEGSENTIEKADEDPDLFGFFVEYLYRDRSILSRQVEHHSELVTLARLYAMGERLMAPKFQTYVLWRFCESFSTRSVISDEYICDLLQIACTEITERVRENPLRSQIFWYAGNKITNLQKFSRFHQLLSDLPDLGKHLCLWVSKEQPKPAAIPNDHQYQRFGSESEYGTQNTYEVVLDSDVPTKGM
jgi:hypothetical protein